MSRITPLSDERASDEVQRVYAYVKERYGKLPLPVSVSANHPEVFRAYIGYESLIVQARRLDKKLKALASVKVAALNGCPFCIDLGSAEVRDAGMSERQMRELPSYAESDAFSKTEKIVLDYAIAMTRSPVRVEDELSADLQRHFDDAQIIEFTAVIAWENDRSRFNHALGLESQGFSEGVACVLPETS